MSSMNTSNGVTLNWDGTVNGLAAIFELFADIADQQAAYEAAQGRSADATYFTGCATGMRDAAGAARNLAAQAGVT